LLGAPFIHQQSEDKFNTSPGEDKGGKNFIGGFSSRQKTDPLIFDRRKPSRGKKCYLPFLPREFLQQSVTIQPLSKGCLGRKT